MKLTQQRFWRICCSWWPPGTSWHRFIWVLMIVRWSSTKWCSGCNSNLQCRAGKAVCWERPAAVKDAVMPWPEAPAGSRVMLNFARATWSLFGQVHDGVHFYGTVAWQCGHADRRPRRIWLAEKFCHDRVDAGKVGQIGEEYIQFYNVIQAATGSSGYGLQIVEDLACLCFKAADQLHADRVKGDLSRQVNCLPDLDGL